jgi:hypothetical protein
MRRLAQMVSFGALGATFLPAALFFTDTLPLPQAQAWLLAASLIWFLTAPFWMEHKPAD